MFSSVNDHSSGAVPVDPSSAVFQANSAVNAPISKAKVVTIMADQPDPKQMLGSWNAKLHAWCCLLKSAVSQIANSFHGRSL